MALCLQNSPSKDFFLTVIVLVFIVGVLVVGVFPSLGFAAVKSSILYVFVDVTNFLGLEFSF